MRTVSIEDELCQSPAVLKRQLAFGNHLSYPTWDLCHVSYVLMKTDYTRGLLGPRALTVN